MLLFSLFLCTLMRGIAPSEGAEPAEGRPADAAAIRAHVETIFRAYQRKDRVAVRRTHAADWRGFLTNSRGVLRGIDAYMREAESFLGGPLQIERWSFRDFDLVFYGEVAILSYVADLELSLSGESAADTLRVLDIYHRSRSQWQQVASQVARHPDALEATSRPNRPISSEERARLLADRETVWRSFFAGDAAALQRLLPEDLVAINADGEPWLDRSGVLAAAASFAKRGGRLTRLEFPETKIQLYGDTAILYTTYVYEVGVESEREAHSGRATEVFVRRGGSWVNEGWHLDSGH